MTTKAPDILTAALGHMQDRAATYDKPEGERSIPATVAAFNAVTGMALTAEQGWLFAILLKAVRSQQGGFKQDNYEDGAAYFALMGEQAAADRAHTGGPTSAVPLTVDVPIVSDSQRAVLIKQCSDLTRVRVEEHPGHEWVVTAVGGSKAILNRVLACARPAARDPHNEH